MRLQRLCFRSGSRLLTEQALRNLVRTALGFRLPREVVEFHMDENLPGLPNRIEIVRDCWELRRDDQLFGFNGEPPAEKRPFRKAKKKALGRKRRAK